MSRKYNVVVVGVGAVGEEMMRVIRQRRFPVNRLTVLARSAREIKVDGVSYAVKAAAPEEFEGAHFAFFAGTEGEKGAAVTFYPEAKKRGAVSIDNGADFRLDPKVPLVVPEVNPEDIAKHSGIIANPNCSTIQMVVALAPLHRAARIKRVIVATYQAVSGTGREAIAELKNQVPRFLAGEKEFACEAYPYRIAFNLIPQIGTFEKLDFTTEEWKMDRETKKILHDDSIQVSATTIRVPVFNVHSEAIYIETEKPLSVEKARMLLAAAPGVVLMDDPAKKLYPMPITADGRDEVFVGRIRKDPYAGNGLHLWVVADNIRKGAASNVVQIAERMIADGLV
ncbi:MAG: aspartate-semialdehyde dehydrogenase [Candidatus Aureabacteria bacterium]|nr:aspartate-semialdehyde dehydrogenase [Candidatus Auribacterota bacterium]